MMLIVVPPKRVDLLLRILDGREPMHVQTLFAESSVERFDGGIVGWFAQTTEVEDHAVRVRPQIHRGADELRAVVAIDALGQAPLETEALERGDHVAPTEALTQATYRNRRADVVCFALRRFALLAVSCDRWPLTASLPPPDVTPLRLHPTEPRTPSLFARWLAGAVHSRPHAGHLNIVGFLSSMIVTG